MTQENAGPTDASAVHDGAKRKAGRPESVEAAAFWGLGALLLAGALVAAALQISLAGQSGTSFDGLSGGGFCAAAGLGARDFLLGEPARPEEIEQTPIPR